MAPSPGDKRARLSLAEEVLSIPYLSKRSVMSFLRQEDVLGLRAASRACCDAVAEHAWDDLSTNRPMSPTEISSSLIRGSVASWRRSFPAALSANLKGHKRLQSADLVHLAGVRIADLRDCRLLTDEGLAHLRGIHALFISRCPLITDAGLAHLTGIETLAIWKCPGITDAGLVHLRGIRLLLIEGPRLTDAALAQLEGASIQRGMD